MKYIRSNGNVIEIESMDSDHIQNAINRMKRKNEIQDRSRQYIALCQELDKRDDIGIVIE